MGEFLLEEILEAFEDFGLDFGLKRELLGSFLLFCEKLIEQSKVDLKLRRIYKRLVFNNSEELIFKKRFLLLHKILYETQFLILVVQIRHDEHDCWIDFLLLKHADKVLLELIVDLLVVQDLLPHGLHPYDPPGQFRQRDLQFFC